MKHSTPIPNHLWPQARHLLMLAIVERCGTSARLERWEGPIKGLAEHRRHWWVARVNPGTECAQIPYGPRKQSPRWAWRAWLTLEAAVLDLGVDLSGILPPRPDHPDDERRTRLVRVTLSEAQYSELRAAARDHHLTMTETARRLITGRPLSDVTNAEIMRRARRRKDTP